MPVTSRERTSTPSLSRSKPYKRRVSLQHLVSPVLSDDGNSCPPSPTRIIDMPDNPGLPTYRQYKHIETTYLESLSSRKRDKALISQYMFDKIWDVLHQPDACAVGTPQFRFWVRKMFTLSRPDTEDEDREAPVVILHENRPVAVQEQLYELFCYCHEESNHGGRDKTCAIIRQHYSWVPKELTAQFVKACPTCTFKRSGNPDLIALVHEKLSSHELKEDQVEDKSRSLAKPESPEAGWQFTGGPDDKSTIPHQIVDVTLSQNATKGCPPTSLSSLNLRGTPSNLLLHPQPSLLHFSPQDLHNIHPMQMLADFSHKGGLPPLLLDVASLCSRSPRFNVMQGDLPSLADAYQDNSKDHQYKLSDLWPENISESLPPELHRLQLSSPVHTQHIQTHQIDPVLLSVEEASRENEDCMSQVSPLSPYLLLGSCGSPSLGFPSPVSPAKQRCPDLYHGLTSPSPGLKFGSLPSRSRSGSMSAYLTPALTSATSSGSVLGSEFNILPFTFWSPPLSPLIPPFTTASCPPTPDKEGDVLRTF